MKKIYGIQEYSIRLLSKLNILFECKAWERPEAAVDSVAVIQSAAKNPHTYNVNEHRKRERNAAIEQKITF